MKNWNGEKYEKILMGEKKKKGNDKKKVCPHPFFYIFPHSILYIFFY